MNKEQIKALRTLLKLTQEELARKLGVCGRTVSAWERGEKQPSNLALDKIRRFTLELTELPKCASASTDTEFNITPNEATLKSSLESPDPNNSKGSGLSV